MSAPVGDQTVNVTETEESPQSVTSSSGSDFSDEDRSVSAVGDIVGSKTTMRMIPVGDLSGNASVASKPTLDAAAVGASGGSASVDEPFEDESQEGQLRGSLRAACRQHVLEGGAPPKASAGIFGGSQAAKKHDVQPIKEEAEMGKSRLSKQITSTTAPTSPGPAVGGDPAVLRKHRRRKANREKAAESAVGDDPAVVRRLRPRKAVHRERAAESADGNDPAVVRKIRPRKAVHREQAAESAVDDRPCVWEGSAVGGSAVCGEGQRKRPQLTSRTEARNRIEDEAQAVVLDPIFQDDSPLWVEVHTENKKQGSVQGSGPVAGEHVFCVFNAHCPETLVSELHRHYHAWINGVKHWIFACPDHWQKLLADVPGRPSASSSDKAGKGGPSLPAKEMVGMFSKFNWQYRRTSPNEDAMLDNWSTSRQILTPEKVKTFLDNGYFHIEANELRHTHPAAKNDVDWEHWGASGSGEWTGSSMILPIRLTGSAVGERKYYHRSVTTICFPAFCYLLGHYFTAAEISDAWVKLPLVNAIKKNRGTSAGSRKRKANANW